MLAQLPRLNSRGLIHRCSRGDYNRSVVASHSPVTRIVPVIAHAIAVFGDDMKRCTGSPPRCHSSTTAPLPICCRPTKESARLNKH